MVCYNNMEYMTRLRLKFNHFVGKSGYFFPIFIFPSMPSHPPLRKNAERAFIVGAEDQENGEGGTRMGREGGRMILS